VLYFRLVRALPESVVLAQVQLSRFLGVKKGSDYQSWLNRINQMSADFVVCAKVRPGALVQAVTRRPFRSPGDSRLD